MVETTRYMRKPFYIDALKVDENNMEGVAEWCEGIVVEHPKKGGKYIRVDVRHPLNARQTRAYPGDWVLHLNGGFKVYTDNAFVNSFVIANGTAS